MNVTAWASGLEVTGDGTGVVSHAGVALVRRLSDKTRLTGELSRALFSGPLVHHDRGQVLADISCAIAHGARAVSDFPVLADQGEAFGQVASVPTAYRTLEEITRGGAPMEKKLITAVSAARHYACAQVVARHGTLPAVRVADKTLQSVTCIRIDATVTPAHSEKELAEGNFKGFGHHPLLSFCDNTGGEPLAWMLRKRSAGSNTAADHIGLVDASVAALPPAWRRNLMVTVDGAGFSHKLLEHLDNLASRRGHTLIYSCGWELDQREKAAIRLVPAHAWQIAIDHRGEVRERRADDACSNLDCGHRACWIEEAHVTELTGLLREGPGGDQLEAGPSRCGSSPGASARIPAPSSACSSMRTATATSCGSPTCPPPRKAGGGRTPTSRLPPRACPGRGLHPHRKQTGIGRFPSHDYKFNQAWLTAAMIAQILLAWLKLLALDGDLAKAEPKTLRYRVLHAAARLVRGGRRRRWKFPASWPWPKRSPVPGSGSVRCLRPADQHGPVPATCEWDPSAPVDPRPPGPLASRAAVIPGH